MISISQALPDVELLQAERQGSTAVKAGALAKGKTLVLFGIPGAFTPTCTNDHLVDILKNARAMRDAGADVVACLCVNDPFVIAAWGEANSVGDDVILLSDYDAAFTRAAGMELDLSVAGLGVRSRRYAMLVRDGKVAALFADDGPEFEKSTAANILEALRSG